MRFAVQVSLVCFALTSSLGAQVIDFEAFPDSSPTIDQQTISDEFESAFGVRFDIVDGLSLTPIGLPQIAKVGSPQTAFAGCGPDTPLEGEGVGESFLTDDNQIAGTEGALLLTLTNPSSAMAGVILDVDRRSANSYEEWTIQALDAGLAVIDTIVVTAPVGPDVCTNNYGPGDARALGFAFERASEDIHAIVFRYTGNAGSVGLAFDAFSPYSIPPAPTASIETEPGALPCEGDAIIITSEVVGGLPGIRYQWQRRTDPMGSFEDIEGETGPTLVAPAYEGDSYRLVARDALDRSSATSPITIGAVRPVYTSILVETEPKSGVFDRISTDVGAYDFGESMSNVLGWTSAEQFYHGEEPPLTLDRAHLFLATGAGGKTLAMVYDIADEPNSGGRAEMSLVFTGATPGYLMQDDPNDSYGDGGTPALRTRHNWTSPNTDGWAVGPLSGAWSVDVSFSDVYSGAPTIEGLDSWSFYSADGRSFTLPLVEDQRVRLETRCGCRADLTGDGQADFFDVSRLLTEMYDYNDDGSFDFFDISTFLQDLSAGCP
jgi:hypothetical protein